MAEVTNSKSFYFDVPDSKRQEINQQLSTERERSIALGEYWVNTVPGASWERFAWPLYWSREERAVAVAKKYLQQGLYTQLPVLEVVEQDVIWNTLPPPQT